VGWRHRVTVFATVISAVIAGSMLLRGILLSGYPLYPSTLFPINVDWRVPAAQADAERAFITSYAQLRLTYDPAAVTGWAWIPAWARSTILTDRFNIVLPMILTFLCLPLLMARSRNRQQNSVPAWAWATLISASMFSLLVWFVQAPAGRFAFIYFWIVLAAVFTISVRRLTEFPRLALAVGAVVTLPIITYILFFALGFPGKFRPAMVTMVVFGAFWITASTWAIAKRHTRSFVALCLLLGLYQSGSRLLEKVLPRLARGEPTIWLSIPTAPDSNDTLSYVLRRTRQGLVVYQARDVFYDTPLPNTRYFNPSLELRVPGDLSRGFRDPTYQRSAQYGYSIRVFLNPGMKKEIEIITPER
jgi:hypothetical protein